MYGQLGALQIDEKKRKWLRKPWKGDWILDIGKGEIKEGMLSILQRLKILNDKI